MSQFKENIKTIIVPVACKYEKKYKTVILMTDIWQTFVETGKCDKALALSQAQSLHVKIKAVHL